MKQIQFSVLRNHVVADIRKILVTKNFEIFAWKMCRGHFTFTCSSVEKVRTCICSSLRSFWIASKSLIVMKQIHHFCLCWISKLNIHLRKERPKWYWNVILEYDAALDGSTVKASVQWRGAKVTRIFPYNNDLLLGRLYYQVRFKTTDAADAASQNSTFVEVRRRSACGAS